MSSVDVFEVAECEEVLILRDRAAEAVALIAVHDTRLGPAHGGIRRWPYEGLGAAAADVVALAQAMTRKCALAGVPAGGGKAVIVDHPGLDRAAAYRLVGNAVERLGGKFFTGPDVGTTEDDLRVVAEVTSFAATSADDGPGDLAAATANGVAAALSALAARIEMPLAGLRVSVQGLGAVGMKLCELLHKDGAALVVCDPLVARAELAASRFGARVVEQDRILDETCDVFAPCALGGVITEAVAVRLPARGVCGAANNIFSSPEAARALHARGVLAVPDFVANAGALIAGATWHLTGERVGPERVRQIGDTAAELLERSFREGLPPHEIALQIAGERVAQSPSSGNQERR